MCDAAVGAKPFRVLLLPLREIRDALLYPEQLYMLRPPLSLQLHLVQRSPGFLCRVSHHSSSLSLFPVTVCWICAPPQELVLSTTYFTASFPNLPCSQPPSRMLVSRGQGISPSVAALRLFVWLVTSYSCLFTSSIRTRCVSHSFTSASPPPVLIIAR